MSGTNSAQLDWLQRVLGVGGEAATPASDTVPDLGALARDLADLAKRIPAAAGDNVERRVALARMANDANAAIKQKDAATASTHVEALRKALGEAAAGPAAEPQAIADLPAVKADEFLATWRTAKDQVDDRLQKLSAELRQYKDEDLNRIAEFGLFGITDRETVGLTASLFEYHGAAPAKRADLAAKLRGAIKAYRTAVDANAMVALVDEAPFKTKVALRATLFGALARIEKTLYA